MRRLWEGTGGGAARRRRDGEAVRLLAPEPRHVDDFIDDPKSNPYARSWLESFRRPAWDKWQKPDERKLFATYKGKRYRVIGCSRMGDVWLTADFDRENGYDERVDVDACSEWSPEAAR